MVLFWHPRLGKVRLRMKNRSLYAVLTRFGIVAAVLTALLVIAPAAAQEADTGPCNAAGTECDYDENDTVPIATYSSADPEGQGIDWSVGGPDGEDFDITGGVLTFKKSPNFEDPSDRGRADDDTTTDVDETEGLGNNVYLVTVTATEMLTEGQKPPAESNSLDVQVTVKDVEEPGTITLDRLQPQVDENLTASFTDPDRGTTDTDPTNVVWEWTVPKVSRPDINNNAHWQAPASTAASAAIYNPSTIADGADDAGNILRVKVTYDDQQGTGKKLLMLSYHPVRAEPAANNMPEFSDTDLPATVTVAEDVPAGRVIGTFPATDTNSGDILTYTLTGANAGLFDIDMRTGLVTVGEDGLDFEDAGPNYPITINAFDPSNDTDTHPLAVNTTNVNEAPTVTGGQATASVPEINSTPPPDVYDYADLDLETTAFTAADQDADDMEDNLPILTLGGDDGSLFNIDAGVVTFKDPPNLEDPKDANQDNKYVVDVIATDDQKLTGKMTLTVTVTQVDEDGKVSFSSIQPAIGTAITASISDPDGSVSGETWQWSRAGTAAGPFLDIDGATTDTYTPIVAIEDDPATLDVNEARTTDEGMFLQATVMYRDKASPEDDPDTDANEGTALNQTVMDTTDNATRARPDVNTAPMFASDTTMRDVKEVETMNAGDAVPATDADGDDIAYTVTGGADMDKFGVGDGGQITINSGTELNFEGDQTSYEVEITATDPFGASDSTTVTLTVTDVNEAPVLDGGDLEEDGYPENMTAVTTFTATDPEGADVTWEVVGTDGGLFTAEGGVLMFKDAPNFEMPGDVAHMAEDDAQGVPIIDGDADNDADNNEYVVIVMATETEVRPAPEDDTSNKLSSMMQIRVEVTDVQEDGTATINWRQPEATTDIMVTYDDPDNGPNPESPRTDDGPVTYQWSVPKVSRPELENDDHWQDAAGTNDDAATYTVNADDMGEFLRVRITYTDAKGADKLFVLSDFPVRADASADNAGPTFDGTLDYTRNVKEHAAVGTLLGAAIAATDTQAADVSKLTYTLGGTDEASFKIDKATGQLSVGAKLDHEAGGVYTVTVTATDPSGAGSTPREVTINALDENDAPDVALADGTSETLMVNENLADDTDNTPNVDETVVGTYVATDVDEGDRTTALDAVDPTKVKLSLGGDDAGAFKLDADDGELRFAATPNFESPADADGNNVYKVSIIATDDDDATGKRDVTITVRNIDEPGTVKLSHIQPAIGRPLMATLTDPDGSVNNEMWQWHSAQSLTGAYAPIEDATTDTYTPKAEVPAVEDDPDTQTIDESAPKIDSDEGIYLRVTVTYRDAHSPDDVAATTEYEEGRRGINDPTTSGDEEGVGEAEVGETADNAVRATPADNSDPDFGDDPITRMIDEGDKGRDVPMAVTADDADGDTLRYEVTGGADMASFDIDDDGQITTKIDLDYEGDQTTYVIEITATDPFDGSGSTMVTIMVTNVNEEPTLVLFTPTVAPEENVAPAFADDATTTFMVYENMDAGAEVGMVMATDEGDTLTYSDDSDYFAVDDMGNITTAMMLDFESMASHMVMVTATDDEEASDSIMVTVNVEDMYPGCTVEGNNGQTNDCEILLGAKATLMGDDATRMLDWSEDTPIAKWHGVRRLTASGRVEWLYLHGVNAKDATDDDPAREEKKLYGTIPAELGGLTEMTRLYLHRNNLSGGIPSELNGLTNLVWLRLYDNMLSGEVPDLSGMTSLERFYVHQNDLTGGVPTKLSDSVTHILVHRNMLTGEIPDLSGMTNLVWLGLYDNMLNGEIPASVGGIAKLERLYLHGNMLMGEVPMEIGNIASLTNLWLENNMLSGELPSSLNELTNLERVQIIGGDNAFEGCIPAALANAGITDALETGLVVCP